MKSKAMVITILLGMFFFSNNVYSAIYHIDADAYISGNGSANSPFKSWNDLPRMGIGDDVYFKCGTTIKPDRFLSINWSGTSINRVIIGAYYLNGSKPVYELSGKKPIISGNDFTIPSGDIPVYYGLIRIRDANYVTIQDLHIEESRGHGIEISGVDNGFSKYPIIQGCSIINSYMSAITINRCPENNAYIADNYVYNSCLAGNLKLKLYNSHPGGIAIANSPRANALIEKNVICQTYGESITVWRFDNQEFNNSGYVTIQDNVDLGRGSIYLNGVQNVVVRRNLVIGENSTGVLYENVKFSRAGISINDEDLGKDISVNVVKNIEVYDNLVGNCTSGILVDSEGDSGLKDKFTNIKIFNNILIANYVGFKILSRNVEFVDSKIENNIYYTPPGSVGQQDILANDSTGWSSDIDMKSDQITLNGSFMAPKEFSWQQIKENDLLTVPIDSFRNAFKDVSGIHSDQLTPPVLKLMNR